MKIFSHTGRFTPAHDKRNVALDFTVPQGVSRLTIKFSYSPKQVLDEDAAIKAVAQGLKHCDMPVTNAASYLPVVNFVTLSFDELGEFRGACHRHPNEQTIIIAENGSTPGIINSPIKAGEWDVVLSIHCAVSDVDYSIDIEGEE